MERSSFKRALIVGAILAVLICIGDLLNMMKIQGSTLTIDFTTGAAIFFIFFLGLFNLLLKKFFPGWAFSPSELILIYIMMIISCAIPTMGLVLYLIPIIAGTKYYATDINHYNDFILPYLKKWTILQDEEAIRWFFEGLPKGKAIPWQAWFVPVFAWLVLILFLYLAMLFTMILLRKRWVEEEKINYPMTKPPMELIGNDKFFKNRLMWLGFFIPFIFGCINAFHNYFPMAPYVPLLHRIMIFRRTLNLDFRISFPMIGFTYFVNSALSFSIWFFCLLTTIQQGFFNITGVGGEKFMPYNEERPLLGWQSLGALIVIVCYNLWKARHHLIWIIKVSLGKIKISEQDSEIASYPCAFWGTVFSFLVIITWLLYSGVSLSSSLIFLFFAFLIYIGITMIICEGGLAATRAPVIAPVVTNSLIGSKNLGASVLAPLGLTFVYASDVRTFVMASAANGLKMVEEIKGKKRVVFIAMLIAIFISLLSSIITTIYLGYRYGAINAHRWFFVAGPQFGWQYIVQEIQHPAGPEWRYLHFAGIGAIICVFLFYMRTRFLWFPFHPLGFAFSTVMMTNALWFSVFISWLVKSLILKYGGTKVYERSRFFFIGLIFGQFVVSGLWVIIDFFTGKTGNALFWA